MYKQLEYLREAITMTLGQTYQIDLPETGLLSGLFLKLEANCTSNATLTAIPWRLQDHIGKIEVIGNGATIIKSANYKNFSFLEWLKTGASPQAAWRNYAENTQFEYLFLPFGRGYGDPDFGVDLSKWDNVELRVTNSSSATYHSTNITASILGLYLRENAGGFRGHVRTELWRSWTTVSDETKYYVLPTEFPISLVAIRALPDQTLGVADTGFANLMDDIDFSIHGGTLKVFKGGFDDLALMNYYEQGVDYIVGGEVYRTADYGFDVGLGRSLKRAYGATTKDGAVASTIATMESDLTNNTFKAETYAGDEPIAFMAAGYAPQCSGWLWKGDPGDPGSLLDPKVVGDVRLNIHTRSGAAYASGTNEVLLERVVSV